MPYLKVINLDNLLKLYLTIVLVLTNNNLYIKINYEIDLFLYKGEWYLTRILKIVRRNISYLIRIINTKIWVFYYLNSR